MLRLTLEDIWGKSYKCEICKKKPTPVWYKDNERVPFDDNTPNGVAVFPGTDACSWCSLVACYDCVEVHRAKCKLRPTERKTNDA